MEIDISTKLAAARANRGWSLETARLRSGLGISTISEFENGKREPSISQLSALAKAYNRSLSYFFEAEMPREAVVLWRERPDDTVAREQEARFRKLCEQYRHLESWCGDIIKPTLPLCDVRADSFANKDAEALARLVRQDLNLGDYPAYGLLSALENECGVKVFHEEFVPTGTAACVCSDDFGMAILLNAGNIWYRRNFDLAHELFHLLTWECFRVESHHVASSEEERFADRFATNLLIPTEALQRAVDRRLDPDGGLSSAVLPAIAQQFRVSIDALMWRIHNIYNFGNSRVEETKGMIKAAKAAERRLDAQVPATAKAKYPKRYLELAVQALITGQISTGKFCEYTGKTRREAAELVSSEDAALGKVQVTSR